MSNLTENMFVEAALENSHNLEMTVQLVKSFPDIVDRVVVTFIQELESQLRKEFPVPDWEITNELVKGNKLNRKRWQPLKVKKTAWGQRYFMYLGFDSDNLVNLDFCFSKGAPSDPSVQNIPGLADDLTKAFGRGKGATRHVEWWLRYDKPYITWNADCILLLQGDNMQQSLDMFINDFKKLSNIAEKYIG